LIAQGSKDSLVDPGGAQLLYDRVGSKDKTLKLYDGFFHEIFNEPDHLRVLNDVQQWMETRAGI
jgi:lysophospholipase